MAGKPVAASFRCGLRWFSGRRWCSGRRRARSPARSPHASFARSGRSRSPPVPSGPSGALHTGGAWCADVWLCFVLKPGQAPPLPTGAAAWPCIPPAPSTPAAPGALTCRAAGCACGFSVPPTPVAMGVLRHAKPSCRVSPTCRRLGWRNFPRWVAVRSRFEVVWPPKCRPIGRKSLKMACFG